MPTQPIRPDLTYRCGSLHPNQDFGGSDADRLRTTPACRLSRECGVEPAPPERGGIRAGRMRYKRLQDIVRLAVRLQGSLGGLTLDDISFEFSISRRTAERLRDAVEGVFGPLQIVDAADTRRHWRLQSDALRRLVHLSAEELAQLTAAADALERAGLEDNAAVLRGLGTKLRAMLRPDSLARIESDLETLVHAEGLAMRPGPRPRLDPGLLALARSHHRLASDRVPLRRAVDRTAKPTAGAAVWAALRQPPVLGCALRLGRGPAVPVAIQNGGSVSDQRSGCRSSIALWYR